eukprot:3783230-Karenia_brevis.AAC.1
METGGRVECNLIAEAHSQMSALFQGLTVIAKQCNLQQEPAQPNILQMLRAAPVAQGTNVAGSVEIADHNMDSSKDGPQTKNGIGTAKS